MPEIRSEILLGRWRFRAHYWTDLSEQHRAVGSFQMSESCKNKAAIYTECADELQNAVSGNFDPLESQRYRVPSEMCQEEQDALMKRHATRNQGNAKVTNATPTSQSVGQAQVEEVLTNLIKDAKRNAERLNRDRGMV